MTTAGRSHSIFGLASQFHQQSTWLVLRSTSWVDSVVLDLIGISKRHQVVSTSDSYLSVV